MDLSIADMSHARKSHEDCRLETCICCGGKVKPQPGRSKITPVSPKIAGAIREHAKPEFTPDVDSYPLGVCHRCRWNLIDCDKVVDGKKKGPAKGIKEIWDSFKLQKIHIPPDQEPLTCSCDICLARRTKFKDVKVIPRGEGAEEHSDEADPVVGEENNGEHLATLDEAPEVEEGGGGGLDLEANIDVNRGPGDHWAEALLQFGIKFFHVFNQLLSQGRTAEMNALIQERSNKCNSNIKPKLAVAYTKATERHFKEPDDCWECPARTKEIMKAFKSAGILKEATLLKEERMASKEDFLRAHSQDLWDKLQEYKAIAEKLKKKKKAERVAYNENLEKEKSLFLNENTIPAALLGAGSVLNCVDFLAANGGVAFALPRPGRSPNLHGFTLNVYMDKFDLYSMGLSK